MTRWLQDGESSRFVPDARRLRWLMQWAQEESDSFCMYEMNEKVLSTFIQDLSPLFHGVPHHEKDDYPTVAVVRKIFKDAYIKKHPDWQTKRVNMDDFTDGELEKIILLLEPHFHSPNKTLYLRQHPDLVWKQMSQQYPDE